MKTNTCIRIAFALVSAVLLLIYTSCGSGEPVTGTSTGTGSSTGTGGGGKVNPSTCKPAGTEAAITKALDKLATVTDWGSASVCRYARPEGPNAVASMAALAFLARGDDKYSSAAEGAADYVAAHINDAATAPPQMDQRNWQFAMGSVCLAEAYKALGKSSYKNAMSTAINSLIDSQMASGGYGHAKGATPCPAGYSEFEVMSNWALIAYAGAKACGCMVGSGVLSSSISFVEDCIYSNGAVKYSLTIPALDVQRTGGAAWAFYINGHNSSSNDAMMNYIKANIGYCNRGHGSASMGYMFSGLGCIYCGQETWDSYVTTWFAHIISKQASSGLWSAFDGDGQSFGDNDAGTYFCTGMYALVLQLDLGNLHFIGGKK